MFSAPFLNKQRSHCKLMKKNKLALQKNALKLIILVIEIQK